MDLDDNRINAKYIVRDTHEKSVRPAFTPGRCIYKVPEYIRKENEDAYTPRLISIGPIHHDDKNLNQMEKQKLVYFQYFRRRLLNVWQQDLEEYTAQLRNEEHRIRSCYSEKYPELDKNKFVRMILLDAVFIIELFLREWEEPYVIHFDDYLFQISRIRRNIRRDLLLVENQIPFFVLERLYEFVPAGQQERRHPNFLELACNYYKAYDPYPGIDNKDNKLMPRWDRPKHLTDLVRFFCVPRYMDDIIMAPSTYPVIRTATKLKKVGITFEPILEGCLLDVKFKKIPLLNLLNCLLSSQKWGIARLQIPTFNTDNSTECILRNLIVFEQSYYPFNNYICHYVGLLDHLIQTEQDVDVLVKSKVIARNSWSDKDLAGLINILGKNVDVNMAHYASLARMLDRHYHDNCRGKFTYLWRDIKRIVGFVVFAFVIISFNKAVQDLWLS